MMKPPKPTEPFPRKFTRTTELTFHQKEFILLHTKLSSFAIGRELKVGAAKVERYRATLRVKPKSAQ